MRWTRRRSKTSGADPPSLKLRRDWYQARRVAFVETVRGRRSRVVLMPRRWHQVGGESCKRRWQESPVTGESAKETVKTIARGMPGVSGVTVVTYLCAFYFCTQGCGRAERPAFPAPFDGRGLGIRWQNSREISGEIAELCLQPPDVVPAKAGTQYSRDASDEPRSRGVLDPRFCGDDERRNSSPPPFRSGFRRAVRRSA